LKNEAIHPAGLFWLVFGKLLNFTDDGNARCHLLPLLLGILAITLLKLKLKSAKVISWGEFLRSRLGWRKSSPPPPPPTPHHHHQQTMCNCIMLGFKTVLRRIILRSLRRRQSFPTSKLCEKEMQIIDLGSNYWLIPPACLIVLSSLLDDFSGQTMLYHQR
jgi:hypothetical protein